MESIWRFLLVYLSFVLIAAILTWGPNILSKMADRFFTHKNKK